jgi:hypothetical protein
VTKAERNISILVALLTTFAGGVIFFTSLAAVIDSYAPVPFHDEWDMLANWDQVKSHTGSALWSIYDQHNEHRIAVPRLLFFSDIFLFDGKGYLNLAGIFVVQILNALLITLLIVRAIPLPTFIRIATFGFVFCAMFSTLQFNNLFWGFQFQFVSVFWFAALAFIFLSDRAPATSQHKNATVSFPQALGILFSIVASFTMANGLLTWVIGLAIGLRDRWKWGKLSFFLSVATVVFWFYFRDYRPVTGHTNPIDALQTPWLLFQYTALYLGHSLSPWNERFATILGGIAIVLTCFLFVVFFTDKNNRVFRTKETRVLISISAFILATALITGLGRLSFGIEQATSGRYATPSLIFWITLAGTLGSISLVERIFRWLSRGMAAYICATVFLVVVSYQANWIQAKHDWKTRKMAAASALLTNIFDDSYLRAVYPRPKRLKELNEVLERKGLSFYSIDWANLPGKRITEHFISTTATTCRGHLDAVDDVESDDNGFRLHGWAVDTDTSRPSETVVFATEDSDIVGIAFTGRPRSDVEKLYPGIKDSGWFGHARVNPGQRITAYALVEGGRSACQLKGQFNRPQH